MAASDLATDSVEGQRSRPSAVMRLDLLKVVGSSPARLASAEVRHAGALGQPVQRGPDLVVGEHARRFRMFGHGHRLGSRNYYLSKPVSGASAQVTGRTAGGP